VDAAQCDIHEVPSTRDVFVEDRLGLAIGSSENSQADQSGENHGDVESVFPPSPVQALMHPPDPPECADSSEQPQRLRRSTRKRSAPKWLSSGEWVTT